MAVKPVLIGGAWRPSINSSSTFRAVNPATGESLADEYPVSGGEDVEAACRAGREAAIALRDMPDRVERLAAFLDDYAARIEGAADALVAMAHSETAYPVAPRLKSVELPRTTNQLRQAAALGALRDFRGVRAEHSPGLLAVLLVLGPGVPFPQRPVHAELQGG